MLVGKKHYYKAKRDKKKFLAHGFNIAQMMNKCKRKRLTSDNSTLIVDNPCSLDSEWWVVEK